MSRHIVSANAAIFKALDDHCAARGQLIANAAEARWINSEPKHKHFMATAVIKDTVDFNVRRKLVRIDLVTKTFFCLIGFEHEETLPGAVEHEVNAAFLTVILAELMLRPAASIARIRDVVEAADLRSDPAYQGHDVELIASLFPNIRILEIPKFVSSSTWNIFFKICIHECDLCGHSWIEGRFATTLRVICELDADKIPYKVLCRSVFDGDPSSFYLALYRCLEALYAYASAQTLVDALGIAKDWSDVAIVLEEKLGWHPREEGSLASLLSKAASPDLKLALHAFGESQNCEGSELVNRAAKKIYWLRNAIVHFRPSQHAVKLENFDWSVLCTALAGIVIHIYDAVL